MLRGECHVGSVEVALVREQPAQDLAPAGPRRVLGVTRERGTAGQVGFEAAAVAAAARPPARTCLDVDVTDVAGRPVAPRWIRRHDDAAPMPVPILTKTKSLDGASAARVLLAERHQVHVVVDHDGTPSSWRSARARG